ncbi:ribonuclease H-like domain-containing protein [Tanacetum coccineum]
MARQPTRRPPVGLKPKSTFVYRPVSTKKAAKANRNPKAYQTPSTNDTPVVANINELERQLLDGKLVLVDEHGKPLEMNVTNVASASKPSTSMGDRLVESDKDEVEFPDDETSRYMSSTGGGGFCKDDIDFFDIYEAQFLPCLIDLSVIVICIMAVGEPSGSNVTINGLDVGNPLHDICSAMVLTWIMNVVSQDVYMELVYSENAANVWKELKDTYDKVDGSVVYNLIQKINTVKQGGSSVVEYYHRLNSLWREFDALTKLPNSLLTRDPLPEVKDAYNVVSREESHRGVPESSGVTESKINATSFAAKSFNNNNYNSNRRSYNNANNNTKGNVPNNKGPNPNLL